MADIHKQIRTTARYLREKHMVENNEKFLELYKRLESLFRDQDREYKCVEESADDRTQNRMRILRQDRNYLVHQDDPDFIQISDEQLRYMQGLIDEVLCEGDLLQDHIRTLQAGCCKLSDTLDSVLRKMSKLSIDQIVVLDKDGMFAGIADIHDVVKPYIGAANDVGKSAIEILSKKFSKKIICARPETGMDEAVKNLDGDLVGQILCTKDGTIFGKVLGVYIPS